MIDIRPMDESYIHIDCLHHGPVDPAAPPRRGREWQDAPELPPHPWSDETLIEVARNYERITEGWAGDPAREFMREMIQRYGACAILAWEDGKVVGQLRFYPLAIAQRLARAAEEKRHPALASSLKFQPDPGALWVQCVMTSRPYVDPTERTIDERRSSSASGAGARRGTGQKLIRGLIDWAGEHGWKAILKVAHADLDAFYGVFGGGGKAFWEKAGFQVAGVFYERPDWADSDNDFMAAVRRQMAEKGMTEQEVWTWYRMAYDL